MGYSSLGHRELGTTEHTHTYRILESIKEEGDFLLKIIYTVRVWVLETKRWKPATDREMVWGVPVFRRDVSAYILQWIR